MPCCAAWGKKLNKHNLGSKKELLKLYRVKPLTEELLYDKCLRMANFKLKIEVAKPSSTNPHSDHNPAKKTIEMDQLSTQQNICRRGCTWLSLGLRRNTGQRVMLISNPCCSGLWLSLIFKAGKLSVP